MGFDAQDIINNFVSGWILMGERPIRIGDFIELGADRGEVEAIHSRYTRIKRLDGVRMFVPNSTLLESTVSSSPQRDVHIDGSVFVDEGAVEFEPSQPAPEPQDDEYRKMRT